VKGKGVKRDKFSQFFDNFYQKLPDFFSYPGIARVPDDLD